MKHKNLKVWAWLEPLDKDEIWVSPNKPKHNSLGNGLYDSGMVSFCRFYGKRAGFTGLRVNKPRLFRVTVRRIRRVRK